MGWQWQLTPRVPPSFVSRVGTGCSGYKIFGPPNQSGKIFGRSVEFGWSLVVTNKGKLNGKQGKLGEYVVSVVTYLPKDH